MRGGLFRPLEPVPGCTRVTATGVGSSRTGEPWLGWGGGAEQNEKVSENVSEVVGDLVVTDGKFPSRRLPAYRL